MCYGGTAINNILPNYDKFYDTNFEIPDYDFFSPNAIELRSNYSYRILPGKWVYKEELDFVATISIKGIDTVGLMNKVTQIISNQMNVNIKSINIKGDDGIFEGIITLKVHNVAFLKELTKKLEKVEAISSITRTYKHH